MLSACNGQLARFLLLSRKRLVCMALMWFPCCTAPSLPYRVSEKGTLQLSIDADSVRRLLLELPRAARPLDDEADSAPYAHYVEREMAGAVNLVKVMQVR
eukprot:GHRQ01026066.1.p5 GENE.GHRQ01026066.1~~GHRQ01026066.1.p5  ORF type:complete len:100 (-),score=28.50 GHRQ01026066.1:269-568(-)